LAGCLNGAATGRDVVDFTKEAGTPTNTGQFVAAIRLAAFGEPAAIAAAAAELCASLEASAPLPGHDAVRVPGADREVLFAERRAKGLVLHPNLKRELDAIAAERGVAPLD
jgi:LDH2 family malate/lactate/ureidoglycolate dehydrogenase